MRPDGPAELAEQDATAIRFRIGARTAARYAAVVPVDGLGQWLGPLSRNRADRAVHAVGMSLGGEPPPPRVFAPSLSPKVGGARGVSCVCCCAEDFHRAARVRSRWCC